MSLPAQLRNISPTVWELAVSCKEGMRVLLIEMILISLIGSASSAMAQSAEAGWNEAGVRIGIQANNKSEYIHQYDAFAVYGLPWEWHNSSWWKVTPNVNFSLGVLNSAKETGFIGSVGPALVLNSQGSGWTADIGINANLMNRRHFGNRDFGSILQFGAYAGINYRFNNGLKIGYRLQHISNGHIFYPNGTPNPGLDTHIIGTSYVF